MKGVFVGVLSMAFLSIAAAEETESGALLRLVSPLAGLSLMASVSAVSAARSKRHLLSTIDPAMADLITPAMMKKIHELQTLEKFLASVPVDGSGSDYQQRIMAMYLSCSGYLQDTNQCLDRIFCEYGHADSDISAQERDVLSIVLYNIMANEFVSDDYKRRLRSAARIGRDFQRCSRFDCPELSPHTNDDDDDDDDSDYQYQ